MNKYAAEMKRIDDHREAQYAELIAAGYDLSNTYTTQEGCVFGMNGAKCPRCEAASKLSYRVMPSGYFVCPACDLMYDEPYFDPMDYITNVDEEE